MTSVLPVHSVLFRVFLRNQTKSGKKEKSLISSRETRLNSVGVERFELPTSCSQSRLRILCKSNFTSVSVVKIEPFYKQKTPLMWELFKNLIETYLVTFAFSPFCDTCIFSKTIIWIGHSITTTNWIIIFRTIVICYLWFINAVLFVIIFTREDK